MRRNPLRDAEVGEVAVPTLVEEHVRRLDVTVHQTPLVGGIECVGELRGECHRLRGLERTAFAQERRQVRPVDVAHGDVELTIELTRLEDRNDARVVE